MAYDIKMLKHIGYNMLRKHIKVEPALYYAAADELGILIMQDMPSLATGVVPNAMQQAEFDRQLELMIQQLKSHTSIFAWVSIGFKSHKYLLYRQLTFSCALGHLQ